MKKQFTLLFILFILVFGSLNIVYKSLPTVKATYVEGVITQDTIWTLVDSPIVLSNNVTVNPGATLTIEPGVEVRFGGDFSLMVNGGIVANGTAERNVHFTTNDPSGTVAWETIEINGTQPSLFINCVIEGARNAVTLDNGSIDVQNSVIRSNSENGITTNGGALTVQNSELANDSMSAINVTGGYLVSIENNTIDSNGNGVLIAGGDQVDVYNNTLASNGNGMLITGQLNGPLDIRQNEISSNNQNGILLGAYTLGNTTITENNVTSNNCGLFISANTSTYITGNYISNNTVGIEYDGFADHQIYFNDIYENGQGVELTSLYNGTVNAAHNYWGQETGPEHTSLNPYGKGNSVGGDGANLVFIPWLTHSFAYSNLPPTAVLWTDKLLVAPGQTVMFVGTDSRDDGSVYQYFFDFNDTGNSGWTTLSLFNHSYSSTGIYVASLTVEDDFGNLSAPAFTTVTVANLPQLETSVTLSNSTVAYNGQTSVTVYVSAGGNGAANANVTLLSVRGGAFSPQSGLTDSNGYFTANFTAPNVAEATNVRIIARASMNGYADGSDYKYIRVLPPLIVQVIPLPSAIISEETTALTVYVTDASGEPVTGANLALSCSTGTLSANAGATDSNGSAAFTLTAPQTLSQLNITVTATASKLQYADGQGEVIVSVEPRRLAVEVTSSPDVILSEGTATITARVTFDSNPVVNATVTVTSDVGGNFSTPAQLTDLTGTSSFVFTAPQTSLSEGINVTVTATATKSGYVDAESQTVVEIRPKVLSVNVISDSYITYSEGKSNVVVHVGYGNTPIQGANVTITTANGSFTQTGGITDGFGNVTFAFTAPLVNAAINLTFSATASKTGYLDNTGQLNITVNPRTFGFQTTPAKLRSGQKETVSIQVTCKEDATSAAGATVTISYGYGGPLTNVTDATGTCTFVITAPQAPADTLNITVTLAKSGYQQRQANVTLIVAPEEQGFPLLTVLLVAIPIVAVVIVLVLIKMKLIVVSTKEETEGQ
ncbi:MAG: right-handed parallel beta-helix repeat-containing protein [Candidatus Bathyarchaeia archaeon]|jgi:hypothetical protein